MIIGTRGSKLALAQAKKVARLLKDLGFETSLKIIQNGLLRKSLNERPS